MSRIILDCREYVTALPITGVGTRATEALLKRIATTLADDGHRVDVITAEPEEHYLNGVMWWPAHYFPHKCDTLIAFERLDRIGEFQFDRLLVSLNRIDPMLAGNEAKAERFVCFSDNHMEVLLRARPTIRAEQCVVIGPGVDMPSKTLPRIRNRLLWTNSPDRGLLHIARFWPRLLELVPDATISVTYDFDAYLRKVYWLADVVAEHALEIKAWMDSNPTSVLNKGELTSEQVLEEQLQAEVFVYPADTAKPGQLFHCFAAQEGAAAGLALVLSATDGLPEVFGDVAEFIPDPSDHEAWAQGLTALLQDRERLARMRLRSRTWAIPQKWSLHAKAWRDLVKSRPVQWTGPGHKQWKQEPVPV